MPKSPWQYAVAYCKATTRAEEVEAVKGCPPEWRDLVRATVRNIKDMEQLRKRKNEQTEKS